MTPKMTALRNTLGVFAAGIAGGLVMAFIVTTFTLAQIGVGFSALMLLAIGKLMYELELSKAECREALKDLEK